MEMPSKMLLPVPCNQTLTRRPEYYVPNPKNAEITPKYTCPGLEPGIPSLAVMMHYDWNTPQTLYQ
jgi:hypothetical protein